MNSLEKIGFLTLFGTMAGLINYFAGLSIEWGFLISLIACAIISYFYKDSRLIVLTLISAILISFSLPGLDYSVLIFVALIPFFFVVQEIQSYKRLFFHGMVAGVVIQTIVFFWLNHTIVVFGGLGQHYAIPIFILYSIAFSLKFPAMLMGLRWIENNLKLSRFITYPIVIMLADFLIYELFPWYLASSQYQNIYFIQIVEFSGVISLTFVIALVNVLLYEILVSIYQKKQIPIKGLVSTGLVVIAIYLFGYIRVDQVKESQQQSEPITVGLVQPNRPMGRIRNEGQIYERLKTNSQKIAREHKLDLLVWPESAGPIAYQLRPNDLFSKLIKKLAKENNLYLFFGNFDAELSDTLPSKYTKIYNNSILLAPDLTIIDDYHKVYLLPFGEFMPFGEWYPDLYKLFQHLDIGFTPGTEIKVLDFPKGKLAPQICYEIIIPSFTRKFINKGGDFIVNITNDMWFGKTRASDQHLALALFRAVENRVPIVRSTNSGISTFVNPVGEIASDKTPLYEVATLVHDIRPTKIRTIYTQFGDWFAYLLIGVFIIIIVIEKRKVNNSIEANK